MPYLHCIGITPNHFYMQNSCNLPSSIFSDKNNLSKLLKLDELVLTTTRAFCYICGNTRFTVFLGFCHVLAAAAILGFRCCALWRLIDGLELLHFRSYVVTFY